MRFNCPHTSQLLHVFSRLGSPSKGSLSPPPPRRCNHPAEQGCPTFLRLESLSENGLTAEAAYKLCLGEVSCCNLEDIAEATCWTTLL